jgi:hypothetical protein
MRTFIQALSLLLFSTLFVFATYKLPDWLPADIYLRLDPLLGINAVFAAREVIPRALWSLVLIGVTLAIGRFFCAYVCPTGASIDFLDFLFFRKKKRPGLKAEAGFRKVKYFLLIIFVAAALTGGLEIQIDQTELTVTAALPDEAPLDLADGLADGFAIGHLGLADVGVDAELAAQTIHDDVEVQLAHP